MQEDNDIKNALVATIALFTIKNSIFCNSDVLAGYNATANYLIIVISIFLYLRCLVHRKLKIRINLTSMFIGIIIICFIIFSHLVNPAAFKYDYVIDDITTFFSYSFLPLIFIPTCNNICGIKKLMFKWGYVMVFAAIVGFFLFRFNGYRDINGLTYSMSYGKNICLPCLIMILKFRDEKKFKDLFLAALIIVFIVMIGSRFPLLYIMSYILILYWNDMNKISRVFFLIITVIVSFFMISDKFNFFINIIEKIPVFDSSSRTINLIKQGNELYDSARGEIHTMLIEKVNNSPIWGYGFGGGVYALSGESPHGFIYDCIGSLGYVFGTVFILVSFIFIIFTWWKNRNDDLGDIMLMFICLFFPTIALQDSIFSAYKFWWLIAFALYYKSKRRIETYEY